jgi:hypothetical protein
MLSKVSRSHRLTVSAMKFSTPTPQLLAHLKELGIKTKEVIYNPS